MGPAPATLTILRQHQSYYFQLQSDQTQQSATAVVGTTALAGQHLVAQIEQAVQLLNQLLSHRQRQAGAPPGGASLSADPLLSLGRLLYNWFLPPAIQQTLHNLAPGSPLLITTNAPEFPWELAHDDSEYLALKYATSRQLLLPQPPRQPRPWNAPHRDSHWSALLIGNPTGDLPETNGEIERLARLIDATPGTAPPRILMRGRATKEIVLHELASGAYDLIHYAGHALFDRHNPDHHGLILAKEQVLTTTEIMQNLGGQPFVFLNGCESARLVAEAEQPTKGAYLGSELDGLAAAFLRGGAAGFLGAFWPLHDASSATLALNFYRTALQGDPVGEALRSARLQVRQTNLFDPQWAAFTLYAHPARTLALPTQLQQWPATILAVCLHEVHTLFEAFQGEVSAIQLNELFTALAQPITRSGGQVQLAMPDLLIGLFGAPVVHQNDAERGVHAALNIVAELTGNNGTPAELNLGLGLSSGEIYLKAGRGDAQTLRTVLGRPVNQAIQLARRARGNTILITAAVQQLVEGVVETAPVAVDGAPTAFQVSALAHNWTRQEARPGRQIMLAGRKAELAQLLAWWHECCQGRGQLVGLAGEAGVGKSRLVDELRQNLLPEPHHWLMAVCPSAYLPGPYELIAQLLRGLIALGQATATDGSRSKATPANLEAVLQALPGFPAQQLAETLALLGELFGWPAPAISLAHLDGAARQRRLAAVVGRLLAQQTASAPVVLVLEDLHWADEASLEVLTQLLAGSERLALLVITTFRPDNEWQPPWRNRRNYHHLHLHTLDEAASRVLLGALLETPEPPAEVAQVLLPHSNGNPLFLRELVTALRESGRLRQHRQSWRLVSALDSDEIPGTVQRVLLARIESLPPVSQRVLVLAAVIGDEVEQQLLHNITAGTGDESGLERALVELETRDFLIRHWDETVYRFRHALVREVVYHRLSLEERQRYHRRIGETLEGLPAAHLEQLAHHFFYSINLAQPAELAEHPRIVDQEQRQKALVYLTQAGQQAQAKYAARTALRHLQQALAVAQTLPDNAALLIELYESIAAAHQTLTELDAAIAHLVQAHSLAQRDVHLYSRRSAELARRIGQLYEWKSEYATALDWLQQGLAQLAGLDTPADQAATAALHIRIGSVHYNQGNLVAAAGQCQRGLNLADVLAHQALQAEAHNLLGIVHDVQGKVDQALAHYSHSLALWQALGDHYQVARVEDNIGQLYLYQGAWSAARDHLQRGHTFWQESEDQYNLAFASINLGILALYCGEWSEAEARFDHSLAIWAKAQNQRWTALCHTNLGLLAIARRQWETAQRHLAHSRGLLLQHQIPDLLPEATFALAEVALGQARVDEALALAREAVALATDQGLSLEQGLALRVLGKALIADQQPSEGHHALQTSLELLTTLHNRYEMGRTLVELAQLYSSQGQTTQAQAALQSAVDLFAKLGAEADLAAAKGLLETVTGVTQRKKFAHH